MRHLAAGVPFVLGAFLIGCGSGTGDAGGVASASGAVASPGAAPLIDENGHPLALPTWDADALAAESEVFRLVNAHRVSRGLDALVDSADFGDLARAHSQHMISHRFVSHLTPEGLAVGDRFTLAGIKWSVVGENLAAGYVSPQEVFNVWMASPGHLENIESATWTHTGVGYARDDSPSISHPYIHYWTQVFHRP